MSVTVESAAEISDIQKAVVPPQSQQAEPETYKPMDSVRLVHEQLECMKYLGGYRDGKPTGQGIDVSIITMPDLVLDFRCYNVEPEGEKGQICTVGGRAGRTASALQHLLDEEDDTFHVSLVSRTGNLGRMLYENEFYLSAKQRSFAPLCLDYVFKHPDEPRCAYRVDPYKVIAAEPDEEHELRRKDLQAYGLDEAIKQARTVYFASIKTPDFSRILSQVIRLIPDGEDRGIFLDTSRAKQDHINQLCDLLKKDIAHTQKFRKVLGIFVPSTALELFRNCPVLDKSLAKRSQALDAFYLSQLLRVPIIQYGDDSGVLYTDGKLSVNLPPPAATQIEYEDNRERFKAGVILASSVYRSLQAMPRKNSELATWFKNRWESPSAWEHILQYGMRMVDATFGKSRDYLSMLLENDADHFCADEYKNFGFGISTNLNDQSFPYSQGVEIESGNVLDLVRLAGMRRVKKLNKLDCPSLPWCNNAARQCIRSECQYNPDKVNPPSAAILFDLDSTLIDSSEQRKRALAEALKEFDPLVIEDTGRKLYSLKDKVAFFEDYIYKSWELFLALDQGNFRQEWNLPGWYKAYILLARNQELRGTVHDIITRYCKDEKSQPISQYIVDAEWAEWKDECIQHLDEIGRTEQDAINRAQAAFESVKLYPYRGVRDLLHSLKATGAYELYIVSEGQPRTQWHKIRSTGLHEYFNKEHVLTTGDAAKPIDEETHLHEEIAALTTRLNKLNMEIDASKQAHTLQSDLCLEVKVALRDSMDEHQHKLVSPLDTTVKHPFEQHENDIANKIHKLKREQAIITRQLNAAKFVMVVLHHMSAKEHDIFYAAVLRAIMRDPHSPLMRLKQFSQLIHHDPELHHMKFVMIGDRQKNDITPPLELWQPLERRLRTIRVLSEKYCEEKSDDVNTHPDFIACTPAQVKALLLSKSFWGNTACMSDPFIFNWISVDISEEYKIGNKWSVGAGLLVHGITMKRRTATSTICTSILAEFLTHCSVQDIKEIFNHVLGKPNSQYFDTCEAYINTLDALIHDGAHKHGEEHNRVLLADRFINALKLGFTEICKKQSTNINEYLIDNIRGCLQLLPTDDTGVTAMKVQQTLEWIDQQQQQLEQRLKMHQA